MYQLQVEQLLKAGAHFGHPTSKWNPNFKPFIATKKNGIHIIDLEETLRALDKAGREITRLVKKGGNVLFVGTKKQAQDVVQEASDKCSMYYVVERWLGGTLTNFSTIKKSIKRLIMLEKDSGEIYSSLTKKEINKLERERIKLADLHRGIKDMRHLPAALVFVDGIHESTAIKEARRLGIPTFGIIDSNTDPTGIDYPIPANDDSIRTIQILMDCIANVILEARGGSENTSTDTYSAEIDVDMPTDKVSENADPAQPESQDESSGTKSTVVDTAKSEEVLEEVTEAKEE